MSKITELHNWHRITPGLLFQALLRVNNFTQRSGAMESSTCKFCFEMLRRCRIWYHIGFSYCEPPNTNLSAFLWFRERLASFCRVLELRSLRCSYLRTFQNRKAMQNLVFSGFLLVYLFWFVFSMAFSYQLC